MGISRFYILNFMPSMLGFILFTLNTLNCRKNHKLVVSAVWHLTRGIEKRNRSVASHFGSAFGKTGGGGGAHDYRDYYNVSEEFSFQNVFSPHKNEKPAFSNSSGLKNVFENLRFHDGLVWTVGLTGEIKLRFEISPAKREAA